MILLKGQTYFKNLAVFTSQDFKSIFGHFTTLFMKGLKESIHGVVKKTR